MILGIIFNFVGCDNDCGYDFLKVFIRDTGVFIGEMNNM